MGLLVRGTLWRAAAELLGFALLVAAAGMVHLVAGLVSAGAVLLWYGNGRA
jgi:hypothetical protein